MDARGNGRLDGELLWYDTAHPRLALIQTTMLLSAITFMYHLSAKVVTDTEYRAQFLDPMLADLRTTVLARTATTRQNGQMSEG